MKSQELIHLHDKIRLSPQKKGVTVMYYYQRLRDLREDEDLTQKDVATMLQTTAQQYSLWERGDREIPFHHVITLARFYRVSIDYIAGLTNRK